MNSDDIKRKLELKRDEFSNTIAGGDPEVLQNMEEWYNACEGIVRLQRAEEKHYEYLDMRGMVALSGKDFGLIQDYIDDECIIIVPKSVHKQASRDMQ